MSLFLSLIHLSYAEVDFKNLKGTNDFFKLKEECNYLAPEIPLNLLRQGLLNQLYLYGKDSDPTVKFVRTAFNSVSENAIFFQISPLARNIAGLLPPPLVGKMIHELAVGTPSFEALKSIIIQDTLFQKKLSELSEMKEQAEERLDQYLAASHLHIQVKKLHQDLDEQKSHYRKLKEEAKQKLILKPYPEGLAGCPINEKKKKLTEITLQVEVQLKPLYLENQGKEANLARLKENLDKDETAKKLYSAIDKVTFQEKNLDHFLTVLLNAFHAEGILHSDTPKHRTEQILLSMGWLNGVSKKDFVSIYEQLPKGCFAEQGLRNLFSQDRSDQEKRAEWLVEQYTQDDYRDEVNRLVDMSVHDRSEYLRMHPEKLAFLSYGRPLWDPSALPTMGFKQVEFIHPITKKKVQMPDCMEYAILNKMLNDLAGGSGNQFNVPALEENVRKVGFEIHPGLKEFLTQYPDPSRMNEMEAHKAWAELISGLPNVEYKPTHPDYEIVPTVSNALEVYEYLLFHKKLYSEAGRYSSLERSQKLDLICHVLSRSGRAIEWNLQGTMHSSSPRAKTDLNATKAELRENNEKDTDLVLEFSVNGQPKYDWTIKPEHSQVDPKPEDATDWRKGVGPEMAKQILHANRFHTQDRRSLAWFLNTSDTALIIKALKSKRKDLYYNDFFNSIPLESVEHKLFVIGELAEAGRTAEIQKIYSKLPGDDRETQRRYHAILADHNYPFPIISKTLTGAEYTRIENHPILGRSWKDPRGVVWGDTVPSPDKEGDKRVNWEDAKKLCLNLNPADKRQEIEKVVKSINSNEELSQLRLAFLDNNTGDTKEALLKKFTKIKKDPIPGCYLPMMEEYLFLGMDLGRNEENNQFVPQFLPHLYGEDVHGNSRSFWSSSVDPTDSNTVLTFGGLEGDVYYGSFREAQEPLRCVCESVGG